MAPSAPLSARRLASALLALLLLIGCQGGSPLSGDPDVGSAARAEQGPSGSPYVLVLGTAQDAGLPQIGCTQACCLAAHQDPARRRLVASLLLADPRTGRRWLIDATPDLREQVERARGHPPTRDESGPRPALFDGIFLTHAHMGHYSGLVHLGREAYDARRVPLHVTPSMGEFLGGHGPWELLIRLGQVELVPLRDGEPVVLAPDLEVIPFSVPHRPEYSDTVGFLIRGPERSLVYIPDIDKWEHWDRPLEDLLSEVDIALLDGSFHHDGEIPGRSMADIPHPFMSETMLRLAPLPPAERAKVWFTHLNHTNPAADPDGAESAAIRAAGLHVAADGLRFGL